MTASTPPTNGAESDAGAGPADPQGIAAASRSCLVILGLLAALVLILCVSLSIRAVF